MVLLLSALSQDVYVFENVLHSGVAGPGDVVAFFIHVSNKGLPQVRHTHVLSDGWCREKCLGVVVSLRGVASNASTQVFRGWRIRAAARLKSFWELCLGVVRTSFTS